MIHDVNNKLQYSDSNINNYRKSTNDRSDSCIGTALMFSKKRKVEKYDNCENKRQKLNDSNKLSSNSQKCEKTLTASEKRKVTLKTKAQNSVDPKPLSEVGNVLQFKYRHKQKAEVKIENANSFGITLKRELTTHIGQKDVQFDTHLGLYYTKETPVSPVKGTRLARKVFELRTGHDIVLDRTTVNKDEIEDTIISPTRLNSAYKELALVAENMAEAMVKRGAFDDIQNARRRIARDIQRVGGGLPIIGSYTREEWSDLSEFGGVIRVDKARAPDATKYIDQILNDNEISFVERFGENDPIYKGTGKGSIQVGDKKVRRGAAALRALAKEPDNGNETDYGSDAEMVG